MAAGLTREDVLRIAALAQLRLSSAEIDLLAHQLAGILAYAQEVQQIDTTGVEPTATVLTRRAADRADEVRPSLSIGEALGNAPDPDDSREEGGFFKVPRVLG